MNNKIIWTGKEIDTKLLLLSNEWFKGDKLTKDKLKEFFEKKFLDADEVKKVILKVMNDERTDEEDVYINSRELLKRLGI